MGGGDGRGEMGGGGVGNEMDVLVLGLEIGCKNVCI